jgi:hypothetical protein
MRPKRSSDEAIRSGGDQEFEDPLKNFEPATYADDLERSLA